MFVELHLLQNFAPSNLNRDDTGSPKECEFGGYRRARISSQCLKRAVRMVFPSMLAKDELATRSKLVVTQKVVPALVALGHDAEQARAAVESALGAVKLKLDDDGRTQYLLFLSESEVAALIEACHRNFDDLVKAAEKSGGGKRTKKEARAEIAPEVRSAIEKILDGGKSADLALFGRMLADLPERNIDAAAQVAHAISTNRVSPEFDYFTAVDDLNPKEETGAGMIGTVEFNSACFYRYTNVDLAQLKSNLKDDSDLARRTLEAFIRASIEAVPSGKQNSMAAQNPPSFVMGVVRETGLWSLANAFLDPVRPDEDGDLIRKSIARLDRHWAALRKMYGSKGIVSAGAVALEDAELPNLGAPLENLDVLVKSVMSAAKL
jgi:CRISPR system Cascade subunit CasC